jgi:hypothetical protein
MKLHQGRIDQLSIECLLLSLIIDYWIDNGIYITFIIIIVNLIIDKSNYVTKLQ